ncbi:2,4-dienoyl-CoA reductase, mitochondrial [Lamellibrachia satsuma]|nr:2,4-dienoyl-CoA reductase, mitochondrial [Lamellibrachia satsuma]
MASPIYLWSKSQHKLGVRLARALAFTMGKTSSCCYSTSRVLEQRGKQAEFFPPVKTPMLPPKTFEGKVALVTGGGTGVGRAITFMLSQLGAEVTIFSRKLDVVQKTADEISSVTNKNVLALQCDVRDVTCVRSCVSSCITEMGLPQIIINASSGNIIAPTERLSPNAWATVVDSTLTGTANVITDVGKRLISAHHGAVFLNISAAYALSGSGYVTPSAAAKAGINALTKSLGSEWTKYGMRFNAIALGPIFTKKSAVFRQEAFRLLATAGEFQTRSNDRIAVGRVGETEEVANLACYLVSDYSNYMNGAIVQFDGGEGNFMAGEFNSLQSVSQENWDMIEATMRTKQ